MNSIADTYFQTYFHEIRCCERHRVLTDGLRLVVNHFWVNDSLRCLKERHSGHVLPPEIYLSLTKFLVRTWQFNLGIKVCW